MWVYKTEWVGPGVCVCEGTEMSRCGKRKQGVSGQGDVKLYNSTTNNPLTQRPVQR